MADTPYNPFEDARWIGFHRETDLATELICDGANAIGQAGFAKRGQYSLAMFGFSNGFERLGKIIFSADQFLQNGTAPSNSELRDFGHNITEILQKVEDIADQRNLEPDYPRPTDSICGAIVATLDNFAAAQQGRYANFNSIAGTVSPHDPVTLWWNLVCEPILSAHFYGTKREARAQERAREATDRMGDHVIVVHTHENGELIQDIYTMTLMAKQREITQQYGRIYTLAIARWMASVFTEMTRINGYTDAPYLGGHYELTSTLMVPDEFLRSRKKWPLD